MTRAPLARRFIAGPYGGGRLCGALISVSCFAWGTSQIAPPDSPFDFTIGWINAGDISFAMVLLLLTCTKAFRDHVGEFLRWCPTFATLVLAFAALGVLSCFTNAFARDLAPNDLGEVLRPVYYLIVVIVVAHFARGGRVALIAIAFALGIVFGSIGNLLVVLSGNGDTASVGLLVLMNPNVTGHMLAISILLSAIALHYGRVLSSLLIAAVSSALVIFTFSKGAWLMALISLACLGLVYRHRGREGGLRGTFGPLLLWTMIGSAATVGALNAELIGTALQFKLQQSFTGETEQSESSVALRFGHILSSLEMTARNPLTGVGVSNWQRANDNNAYWLNDVFLVNDNPHNGFFYVLSGMGMPALIVFFAIMLFPVTLIPYVIQLSRRGAVTLQGLFLALLLLSGNVMQHIVSHYYFWLFCGLAFGCAMQLLGPASRRASPAATFLE